MMELNASASKILPPLHIDVVLCNIFKFLSTKDLKSCRLVCQNWRHSSKGIFQKRVAVVFHTTESPLHIRFFGRGLKASTTNFMHVFQGEEIPSDSYYFYNEAWNWGDRMNCQFLMHYGRTIRNFKATVRENTNTISVEEILSFRNNLLMFMPNLEELSLKITLSELHPRSTTFAIRKFEIESADANSLSPVQLTYLKKLRIRIGCEGRVPLTQIQKEIVIKVFQDIIKRTKRLESLDINVCPAMFEMIEQIPVQYFKYLNHVSINDWKCSDMDADYMIYLLSELTTKKAVKLLSLSTHFKFGNCENHHVRNVVRALMDFLTVQKNHLQKLSISLPNFVGGDQRLHHVLNDNRNMTIFPKMSKLSVLKLNHSQMVLQKLFRGCGVWSDWFPELKVLDYEFRHNYADEEELSLYTTIRSIQCASLTKIKINMIQEPVIEIGSRMLTLRLFCELYEMAKNVFPNLKKFKVKYINGDEDCSYSSDHIFAMANLNRPHGREGEEDYDEEGDEDPHRRFQDSELYESEYDALREDIGDDMDMMHIDDDEFDDDEFFDVDEA